MTSSTSPVKKSSSYAAKRKGRPAPPEEEYEDTPETHKMRQELQAINQWLAHATLHTDAQQDDGSPIDTQKRTLQRIFNNGSFDEGGRLYGASGRT